MATPGNNAAGTPSAALNHLSPTILKDAEGHAIVPTEIPPSIAMEDYGEGQQTEAGSYFPSKVPEKDTTASAATDTDSKPLNKRTTTAPIEYGVRPNTGPRRSTLLARNQRRATGGARPNDDRRAPYSYTWDPMSESSDSSSSEEDDEKPAQKVKGKKAPQKPRKTDTVDFANEDQQRKQREKQGHSYQRFKLGNENFKSKGRISKRDGRLNISINETANSGYIAKALGQSLRHHLDIPKRRKSHEHHDQARQEEQVTVDADAASIASSLRTTVARPILNIVIMVIGSRGDIQPFLKVGKILKHEYGHRVRIASHPTFRDFVEKDSGLEFFSVGGDPSELMAFMVKNPGLIPNLQTIREGEIQRRRNAMAVMFEGFWRACINTTDDEKDKNNLKMMGDKNPFVADAIIANPPSMAHVHIAEKLGIPLHMMFTFPYSPTQAFPHPLANIKPQKSNVDANYVNFMSYPLVEMMTWQGLGDIVNRFRERTLGLEPVSSLWAPGALYRMKVPYTYMWSPSLVSKPKDWGPEIDIAGFVFLDLASNFKPEKDLEDFLNAGEPPIYIGFGSIVVDDPNAFTQMIFEATKTAGVRALVNKGWGGLGQDGSNTPDHIFMLGNTPHDWLFPKVKAVVHHGGAGTTAIGLKCGKPTMIVPFFGDQPFWGAMVAEAKAGAHECIPYKRLNAERLAQGIKQCLEPEAQENVKKIADSIANEGDGAENAVKSFHRSLPLAGRCNMRCSILEDRVAVWQLRKSSLRLSALAAELLHEKGKIKWSDLKLLRHYEWNDFEGPGEPITGTVGAVKGTLFDVGEGVGMVPVRIAKHVQKRQEHERKKAEHSKRKEARKQVKNRVAAQNAVQPESTSRGIADSTSENPQRPSVERELTTTTMGSAISADPTEPLAKEVAGDVGWGFRRAGGALLTMPNDLHVAIAQGFHNAPRLWGDVTVRKPVRITGFRSGCVAARKEFTYGVWDGWTGLVTQPVGEWKDAATVPAKFAGLGTGLGKGVGGFVLKNISAIVSPPAFVGKGAIRYLEKRADGPGTKNSLRRARIIQGQRDLSALQKQGEGDREQQQLREVKDHVNGGWKVYEELWHEAGKVGNSFHLKKEKQSWEENGALENAATAKRALEARKNGHSLDKLFAKRRREIKEAEQPRAGAMDQPEVYEEKEEVLPNGRQAVRSSVPEQPQERVGSMAAEEEPERYLSETGQTPQDVAGDYHSETTAVNTSDEEDVKLGSGSNAQGVKFQGKPANLIPNGMMTEGGMVSV